MGGSKKEVLKKEAVMNDMKDSAINPANSWVGIVLLKKLFGISLRHERPCLPRMD